MNRYQRAQHYKRRLQKVLAIERADTERFKPNPRGPGFLTKAERYVELRWRLAELIDEYREREPEVMTRRRYFELAKQQPLQWLKDCAANPSAYMRPRHIALIKLAIRTKE